MVSVGARLVKLGCFFHINGRCIVVRCVGGFVIGVCSVFFCRVPFGLPLVVFWCLFCRFSRGVGRLFVSVWLTGVCRVGAACRVVVGGVVGRWSWAAVVSLPVLGMKRPPPWGRRTLVGVPFCRGVCARAARPPYVWGVCCCRACAFVFIL